MTYFIHIIAISLQWHSGVTKIALLALQPAAINSYFHLKGATVMTLLVGPRRLHIFLMPKSLSAPAEFPP